MNKKALIIAGALVVAAGAYYFLVGGGPGTVSGEEYVSETFGISFEYTDAYIVEEHDLGNGERARQAVVLMAETDVPLPENGEGPPTITIEAFQNDLDTYTADTFVRETNFSNFKLSPDGTIIETSVAGEPALSFRWSGLYEGRSIVVALPRWVYVFSVSYFAPEDAIVSDFENVLESVRFSEPSIPLKGQNVGIANPASTNCVELSGTLEIVDGSEGQYGLCHLPDGRVCEEWALFRDGSCVVPEQ